MAVSGTCRWIVTCEYVVQHIIHCEWIETQYDWLSLHFLADFLHQGQIDRADIAQILGDDHVWAQGLQYSLQINPDSLLGKCKLFCPCGQSLRQRYEDL